MNIENTINLLCEAVEEPFKADYKKTKFYIKKFILNDSDENTEFIFTQAIQNNCENLDTIVSTSALSEIFWLIKKCILADDEITDEELETAYDLLQDSMYRFSWRDGYEEFDPLISGDEVLTLLEHWEEDPLPFGGDFNNGSQIFPLQGLVGEACCIAGNMLPYKVYKYAMLDIARKVLETGSVVDDEQDTFDELQELYIKNEELFSEKTQALQEYFEEE